MADARHGGKRTRPRWRPELVYVYIFGGGIPHLHVHLAPHRAGDALNENIIRGELDWEPHPSGAMRMVSREFPELPSEEIATVAQRVRRLLAVPTGD